MLVNYNNTFKQLLAEYNLSDNFLFAIDLPKEITDRLNDQIIISELGIALKSYNSLYKPILDWENQSIIEDNENHFHVDGYIKPSDNKKAFMLGIMTLKLLAEKIEKEA